MAPQSSPPPNARPGAAGEPLAGRKRPPWAASRLRRRRPCAVASRPRVVRPPPVGGLVATRAASRKRPPPERSRVRRPPAATLFPPPSPARILLARRAARVLGPAGLRSRGLVAGGVASCSPPVPLGIAGASLPLASRAQVFTGGIHAARPSGRPAKRGILPFPLAQAAASCRRFAARDPFHRRSAFLGRALRHPAAQRPAASCRRTAGVPAAPQTNRHAQTRPTQHERGAAQAC
jgi:hypothetical protein